MEAKELRVGNYVTELGEVIYIGNGNDIDYHFNFKPIPLTEEWLLKFGYELQKSGTWLAPHSGNFIWFSKDLSECSICDEYFMQHIKYVHQLQNLYFALTNKELTIKE